MLCVYIYIYIERERDVIFICIFAYVCIDVFMYVCINIYTGQGPGHGGPRPARRGENPRDRESACESQLSQAEVPAE